MALGIPQRKKMGVITFVVLYYLNIDYERTNRSRAFGGSLKSKFGVFRLLYR
ncbi:hypothetical protein M388_10280 [Mesotoga sp. Brook.08.YT.4.2.5.4.]|nr:hypothetical protein M388_10280 [Mesotoga sp. Brook.08.YT.4.2.5.4.]